MEVRVLFFGVLAEVASTSMKYYRNVRSTDELRIMIFDEFPEMAHYNFRISVNNSIVSSAAVLHDADEVALLPPFAGG
jgi:molybdopterin converting factor small subunit